ncbi:MAG: hypothetical protein AB7G39_00150 [Alphaproteobacteria bacterium]
MSDILEPQRSRGFRGYLAELRADPAIPFWLRVLCLLMAAAMLVDGLMLVDFAVFLRPSLSPCPGYYLLYFLLPKGLSWGVMTASYLSIACLPPTLRWRRPIILLACLAGCLAMPAIFLSNVLLIGALFSSEYMLPDTCVLLFRSPALLSVSLIALVLLLLYFQVIFLVERKPSAAYRLPSRKLHPPTRNLAARIAVQADRVITALSNAPYVRVGIRTASALLGFASLAQSVNILLTELEPLRQIYTDIIDPCLNHEISDFRILQVAFSIVLLGGYFVLAFYPTNRPERRAVTWLTTEIGLLSALAALVANRFVRLDIEGLHIREACKFQPIYETICLTISPIFFSVSLLILFVLLWHSRRTERRTQQFQGNENGR